jgi:hypothetical protein
MSHPKDNLPQHLEFIQNVVERHARSSFLLKGWSVTLVAAVFLLAVRGADPQLAMLAGLLPALIFWGLDAYYLRQERKYRALYDHVRRGGTATDDRFTLDAGPFSHAVPGWSRTLMAPPLAWFYVAVLIVVLGALAFFSLRGGYGT